MKKLSTILIGLFLVATTFANVESNELTPVKGQDITKTTVQNTRSNSLLIDQINEVMILRKKHGKKGGPVVVIETCATKCQDDL